MRSPEEISAMIDKFDLTKQDGISDLERHVRRELTIYEVEHFSSFIHGGTFMSAAGWTRNLSGRVAATEREDSALAALWCRLMRAAHFSLGAAAVVEMQSAKMRGRAFFTDEGNGPSPHELTLDEIAKRIPEGVKARIERDLAPAVRKASIDAYRRAQSNNAKARNREKTRAASSQK